MHRFSRSGGSQTLLATIVALSLAITGVASAQIKPTSTNIGQATVKTYHPTITNLSTRTPTPGQTLTINGSDLLPPTWTATLQYHDKYGGNVLFMSGEINKCGAKAKNDLTYPTNVTLLNPKP